MWRKAGQKFTTTLKVGDKKWDKILLLLTFLVGDIKWDKNIPLPFVCKLVTKSETKVYYYFVSWWQKVRQNSTINL